MTKDLIRRDAVTVNGRTLAENCADTPSLDHDVIRPFDEPLVADAGFLVMTGNLFESAIMKTSVISPEFRDRYLANPDDPDAFVGTAIVFDGPEDFHRRIDDAALGADEYSILFMRGVGPIGYPGSAEVVNMRAPSALLKRGVTALPCVGDGRQSGTSGSPSILNASPEAAEGSGLAVLRSGDRVRIDLGARRVDVLIDDAELTRRLADLAAAGGYAYPDHQTPWQEIQRGMVDRLDRGMVLKPAVKYQRIVQTKGMPRDNH
jgi:dihydroxy-acid dehydratase